MAIQAPAPAKLKCNKLQNTNASHTPSDTCEILHNDVLQHKKPRTFVSFVSEASKVQSATFQSQKQNCSSTLVHNHESITLSKKIHNDNIKTVLPKYYQENFKHSSPQEDKMKSPKQVRNKMGNIISNQQLIKDCQRLDTNLLDSNINLPDSNISKLNKESNTQFTNQQNELCYDSSNKKAANPDQSPLMKYKNTKTPHTPSDISEQIRNVLLQLKEPGSYVNLISQVNNEQSSTHQFQKQNGTSSIPHKQESSTLSNKIHNDNINTVLSRYFQENFKHSSAEEDKMSPRKEVQKKLGNNKSNQQEIKEYQHIKSTDSNISKGNNETNIKFTNQQNKVDTLSALHVIEAIHDLRNVKSDKSQKTIASHIFQPSNINPSDRDENIKMAFEAKLVMVQMLFTYLLGLQKKKLPVEMLKRECNIMIEMPILIKEYISIWEIPKVCEDLLYAFCTKFDHKKINEKKPNIPSEHKLSFFSITTKDDMEKENDNKKPMKALPNQLTEKSAESYYPHFANEDGVSKLVLGPNGTTTKDKLDKTVLNSYKTLTRFLLRDIFCDELLATQTLTGKPSPAFFGRVTKSQLNQNKVADIIYAVQRLFPGTEEREIRCTIKIECANQHSQQKKKQFRTSSLQRT